MHSKENAKESLTYAAAGVDIDAGNKAVELMKDSVKATYRPEVLGDLGGFGGLFSLMNSYGITKNLRRIKFRPNTRYVVIHSGMGAHHIHTYAYSFLPTSPC